MNGFSELNNPVLMIIDADFSLILFHSHLSVSIKKGNARNNGMDNSDIHYRAVHEDVRNHDYQIGQRDAL